MDDLENVEFEDSEFSGFSAIDEEDGTADTTFTDVRNNTPHLLVRFEMVARLRKDTAPFFVAPGQVIPVYQKKKGEWFQVLNGLEFRAEVLPLNKGRVWVMGDKKPTFEVARKQQPTRGTLLSSPGGRHIVRPHPRVPGAVGLSPYPGPDLGYELLSKYQIQSPDFIHRYEGHPVSKGDQPFRWVIPTKEASSAGGLFGMDVDNSWGYNPLTNKRVENLQPTGIPIGWKMATDVVGEDFCAFEYAEAVEALLGDTDAQWIYAQNCISSWGYVALEERMLTSSKDLPQGLIELPWVWSDEDRYGEESISPLLFEQLRRLKSLDCK